MAELDPNTFEGTYNNPTTGSFKTTGLRQILAATMRQFVTDIKDSFASNHKQVTATVGASPGDTITLDFSTRQKVTFVGSGSFASSRLIALANDSAAVNFKFAFEITDVAATLDFGSGSVFKSTSNDFDPSTQIFTFSSTGLILITGTKVGSNWWLTVEGPFA